MNAAKEMLLLSQEDLLSANCLDFKAAVEVCRQALVAYSEGDVIAPEKVSVIFDERTQDRINCLPAGFRSAKTYGMKWVSVFPENPRVRGIQNVGALSLLSSMEDGNPLALMDSTMLSGLRTAAMSNTRERTYKTPCKIWGYRFRSFDIPYLRRDDRERHFCTSSERSLRDHPSRIPQHHSGWGCFP